ALLRAGDDAIDGLVELGLPDRVEGHAGRQESGLVQDVGQVCAGEAGCAARDGVQVHVGGQGLALGVDAEDVGAAVEVGRLHRDLAVESAGTQQRRVQDVGSVGGRDQ